MSIDEDPIRWAAKVGSTHSTTTPSQHLPLLLQVLPSLLLVLVGVLQLYEQRLDTLTSMYVVG
jgi:hypothetical protein